MQERVDRVPPGVWEGQALHFGCLGVLLGLVWLGWDSLGRPVGWAFWMAVGIPVVHQVFVWLAWRIELRGEGVSRVMGFRGYLVCFLVLFFGRIVSLSVLAWMNRGGLGMDIGWRVVVTALLVGLGGYAGYSVVRYFGMERAAGADHFDAKYRKMGLVREGIFRLTNNGMYMYVFLLFWAIGIGFNSIAGLLVAGFSHAYIWVHYYGVEKKDMAHLYGGG